MAGQSINTVTRAHARETSITVLGAITRQVGPPGVEQAVVEAWRSRPFKPSPPPQAELERAFELREMFRARGFDLRLGRDGSVLIADLTGQHRAGPPALTKTLWKHVEVVGAFMDREQRKRRP